MLVIWEAQNQYNLLQIARGVHRAEAEWINNINQQYNKRPIPEFYNLIEGSCNYDILLNDNDIIDLDEQLKIKIIHTPGHSPGSISVLLQQENALFTGDAIPVYQQQPIYDNWKIMLSTLEKIENLPYANILLSACDKTKKNDKVQTAISQGIELVFQIHSYYINELKSISSHISIETIAQKIYEHLNFSTPFNPLFIRTIKSHVQEA